MRNKHFFALVVFGLFALALVITGACGKDGSRNPNSPSPPPDQSRYETLPAKKYLIGVDGNPTEMWATLHWVRPERGSTVQIGPSACPDNCFRWSLEVGLDMIPGADPTMKAAFESWFSLDGKNKIEGNSGLYRLNGGGARMGQSQMVGSDIIRMFQTVPKYVWVGGRQFPEVWVGPSGSRPADILGSTSFELDYR